MGLVWGRWSQGRLAGYSLGMSSTQSSLPHFVQARLDKGEKIGLCRDETCVDFGLILREEWVNICLEDPSRTLCECVSRI